MADNPLLAALTQKQPLPAGDVSQALAGGQGRLPMQFGLGQQGMGGAPGPGTGGRQVSMGAPAIGGGAAQSPAVAAQAAFNAKWGAVPAQQALAARNAGSFGVGGTEQTAAGAGGPTTGQPKAVGPAPAQASQMNAASPGILNGNPENGIPKAEAGVGTPPTAAATQTATAGREAMAPGQGNDLMAALSAPAPQTAQSAQTTGEARSAATPGPAPLAQNQGNETFAYGGKQYTSQKPLPPNWNSWTNQQRNNWIQNNATVASTLRGDTQDALKGYPDLANLKYPYQDPVAGSAVVYPGMSPGEVREVTGDETVQRLAMRGMELYERLYGSPVSGGQNSTIDPKDSSMLVAIQNALKPYGISFSMTKPVTPPPVVPPPAGGDGGGTTTPPPGGSGGGTTTPPPAGGGATTPPATPETPMVPGPDPTTGQVGDPAFPGTNLDQSNVDPWDQSSQFTRAFNYWVGKGYDYEKAMALTEASIAAGKDQDLANNTQSAINLFGGAVDSFQNSPLYTGVQGLAENALKNPDPVDWTGNKNRLASDYGKSREQTASALSEALAGRGLSASTGAGLQTMLNSQNQMDLSRALGEMTTEEQRSKRAAELQAMQMGLGALGGTTGVALSNAGNLANLIRGTEMNYQNPYSGTTAAFMNINAMEQQLKAAEDAGAFSWGDAAGLIGTLGGAFLGGPAGAAILGGAATAATAK